MKRSVAFLLLTVGLTFSCGARETAAQGAGAAPKVAVTLVRWPYT